MHVPSSIFTLVNHPTSRDLWTPDAWRKKQCEQTPHWLMSDVDRETEPLKLMPGLVTTDEVDRLLANLAMAAQGDAFVIHAGDCAERFSDCTDPKIRHRLEFIYSLGLLLKDALKKKIILLGRMAGQYAKPRSQLWESDANGVSIPVYRGDMVNGFEATLNSRQPDPRRLAQAYHASSATLNFIRSQLGQSRPNLDDLASFAKKLTHDGETFGSRRWSSSLRKIKEMQHLFESNESDGPLSSGRSFSFLGELFVSHEALILPYEESLTRQQDADWYNLGTHFLWLGDRTRGIDHGHVEYLRGLKNPVGVKVGPELAKNPLDCIRLLKRLNPSNQAGRVTLITRLGVRMVSDLLPGLISSIQSEGLKVNWMCDPMHGNTKKAIGGIKTRYFDDIAGELLATAESHHKCGSILSGLHIETTPEAVTECIGGAGGVASEAELQSRYETWCDPRLNPHQAIDLVYAYISGCVKSVAKNSTH